MSKQFQENYSLKNKLQYEEKGHPEISFVVADNANLYQKGMAVTLTAAGEVEYATAADFVIGHVKVANVPNNDLKNTVTVVTVFKDVAYGFGKTAPLVTGTLLTADGKSTVDGNFMDYITAATGQYASGLALVDAAIGAEVIVGLLATPIYKA